MRTRVLLGQLSRNGHDVGLESVEAEASRHAFKTVVGTNLVSPICIRTVYRFMVHRPSRFNSGRYILKKHHAETLLTIETRGREVMLRPDTSNRFTDSVCEAFLIPADGSAREAILLGHS